MVKTSRCLTVVVLLAALHVGAPVRAQEDGHLPGLFHTRSIVACDPAEGACGIAVVSFPSGVPAVVPVWDPRVPGVIVANQSFPDHGTALRIVDNVASGLGAREALTAALADDPGKPDRQLGVAALDPAAPGGVTVASFTGRRNFPATCAVKGTTYVVQANLQSDGTICQAMADAFEASERSLAYRLLSALRAGIAVGGDARGEYSASLRVLNGTWPLASITPMTADANVVRATDWIQQITWQVHAYRGMLAPADPRDAVALEGKRLGQVLRALKRLGYYQGGTGAWSAAAEAALGAFAANNLFFPAATVDRDGVPTLDLSVANFLVQGEKRRVLIPGS